MINLFFFLFQEAENTNAGGVSLLIQEFNLERRW